ncbi:MULTISPECIES: sensor histidine kinase [Paenibacillus]|uniref:histidine kinase n=1 Tax=Paenibacillus campinasensis TaxID=66347 RepID=A0A268EDW3_9BACL|nr:HAMP domain-containing sensor histidine kinase [Paenibacillus campinasensis]MUG65372.1 HAMP domain-containing protein [Paenibacillus campinasensis]PAD71313.1 two-component sensor histidine kinase [Paenibacillus campinasensis]
MKWRKTKGRFRNSLTSRYLLLIMAAMMFMPIVMPLASVFYWFVNDTFSRTVYVPTAKYTSGEPLVKMWHAEAAKLGGASAEHIGQRLGELREEYPELSILWVDARNEVRVELPEQPDIPDTWSAEYTVQFMKTAVGNDPFTVVAFIGGDEGSGQGFMVMRIPRQYISVQQPFASETTIYAAFMAGLSLLFILVSWLFFVGIRRRLIRLRKAMTSPHSETGIPQPVQLTKRDEIGQLEEGYNDMVQQLKIGLRRQREEEELRKALIANLSHDLRTPLTVIRSHIFSIGKEQLSEKGQESLALMESKIGDLGELIDNLLSYNLLTSGRIELKLSPVDILRLVRESAAAWYPVWEKSGIEPDIDLEGEPVVWDVDELWFRRIVDNLFQNVVRHAKAGGYIGIRMAGREDGERMLVISDRGPGMNADSEHKGTGIGLAIVEHLAREMGLDYEIVSSAAGSAVRVWRKSNPLLTNAASDDTSL